MKRPSAWPGEETAWSSLTQLDPRAVEANAGVVFDSVSSTYLVTCFGQAVRVSLRSRSMSSRSRIGKALVGELGRYSRLSILRYLIDARGVEPSGQLVKPADLPGGQIFRQGTQVLPLDKVAERFSDDPRAFLHRGRELGGVPLSYGDASIELHAFPRFPVALILWSGHEEFPPHASLLLDSSCAYFATDVIWAVTKTAVELLLL